MGNLQIGTMGIKTLVGVLASVMLGACGVGGAESAGAPTAPSVSAASASRALVAAKNAGTEIFEQARGELDGLPSAKLPVALDEASGKCPAFPDSLPSIPAEVVDQIIELFESSLRQLQEIENDVRDVDGSQIPPEKRAELEQHRVEVADFLSERVTCLQAILEQLKKMASSTSSGGTIRR